MDDLEKIIQVADNLANGDLQVRTGIPHNDSPTGHLADAIDIMAENMLAYRRHIEQITRQYRRSIHAHRTLSASNRALLRATDETSELREVCRLLVEVGNYPFAWIGYAQHDAKKSIRPVAHFGVDGSFLEQLDLTWDETGLGLGAVGSAIRTGLPIIAQESGDENPGMLPWRRIAHLHGFTSVLGLPLRINGQVVGAVGICAEDLEAFNDKDEVRLLEEAVDDLAFAIETLRARQRQHDTEEAYHRISRQNALILESAAEGIYGIDAQGLINFINPAAAAMLGYDKDDLIGCNSHEAFHHSWPDGSSYRTEDCPIFLATFSGNAVNKKQEIFWHRDGTPIPVEISSSPIIENDILQGAVITVTDISERKRYLEQLERKSNFDELTELPNRNLLQDRLNHAIEHCRQDAHLLAVLVININQFRKVIDSLGHASGDLILQNIAGRLRMLDDETDTLARTGGDEFVWISEVTHAEEAAINAKAALEALEKPIHAGEREVFLTASIGISIFPRDGADSETVLKNATTAMHRAKGMGEHRFSFYATEMNARSLERLDMESALRRALNNEELVLYYQPQLNLHTGAIYGAEVLLRWMHPRRGLIPPSEFIPMAEASGLIVPIGEWVLRTACSQNKAWQNAGFPDVALAVNISPRQVDAYDIAKLTHSILQEYDLHPKWLELELTESTFMSDAEAFIDTIKQLKDIGVMLSIDDFGTGYSSLSYLKRFDIDRLKIDQSFVRDITHDPNAAAITLAIMALAKSLGMTTIAEGVETQAQLNFLRSRGCDEMQGYFFSKPQPGAEFMKLLQNGSRLNFGHEQTELKQTLLLVDDAPETLAILQTTLQSTGCTILTARSGLDALHQMAAHEVGVVIADSRASASDGVDFLSKIREIYPDTVRMILVSPTDTQSVAGALNQGDVFQFITKPWQDKKLLDATRAALRHYETRHPPPKTSMEHHA